VPFIRNAQGDTVAAPYGYYETRTSTANFVFRRDTIIGDASPDFEMSFSNELQWRNLSLSALLDWRKGGLVSSMTNTLYDEGLTSYDYDQPYTFTNDQGEQEETTLGAFRYNAWNGGSDARIYVQDGSFVKLREVTLAYSFPSSFAARYLGRARDLRLSLSGRNLAIWSDYWGMDPEVSNFGNQNGGRFVDLAPFPSSRSFFFSVDVGF